MKSINTDMGYCLRVALAKKCLTQADFADMAKRPRQEINRWIKRDDWRTTQLFETCTILQMPVDEFLRPN